MLLPKGLKVGHVFKDGKLTYKIIRIAENGSYISKMIDPSEVKEEKAEPEVKEQVAKPKTTRKTTKKQWVKETEL